MKFRLHQPTLDLLQGLRGIELGPAAHNPFGVDAVMVAPHEDEAFFAQAQRELGNEPVPIDAYGEANSLPFPDHTQDFVLSSHVVEHIPDLLGAFREWERVLRLGGYVVMIVPQMDALVEDRGRPLTPHEHFIEDYALQHTRETHPGTPGGHYHLFTSASLRELIKSLFTWQLVGSEDPDTKVGNGFWLAYRIPL